MLVSESRNIRWLAAVALGLLILVAYANSFQAELTLDSRLIVGLDPRIKGWSIENLQQILSQSYWGAFARSDLYRPLTTLSYLANYSLLGNEDRAFGYHVFNLLLHAGNVWLAFEVLLKLGARVSVAWYAAALFAVHPVNVEAVTNIVGRADLLAMLTVVAAGWCYLRAAEARGRVKVAWLTLAGAIACVGAMAKENAIMALGFAVLYDGFWRWPAVGGANLRIRLLAAAREFALKGWVAFLPAVGLLLLVRRGLGGALTPAGYSFVDNPILYAGVFQGVFTAIGVIGRYLMLILLPGKLSCDYSYNQIPLYGEGVFWWQDWIPWLSLLLIALLGWLVVRWRKSHRLVAWGIAFFFVMLLPVSNLPLRIGSIMAERFIYLPSLGLCTAIAVGIGALWRRPPAGSTAADFRLRRVLVYPLPLLVVAALVLRTHARNTDWRDERAIWKSAVEAAPNSFKAHLGYSTTLFDGRNEATLDEALARAEVALRILEDMSRPAELHPQTVLSQLGSYYRAKGEFLSARNDSAEARAFFLRAVEMLAKARDVDRRENESLRQRLLLRGRAPTEVVLSGNAKIYLELAMSYMHLKNWAGLESAAHEIQRFAPSHPSGYAFEAVAEANSQRNEEAAVHFLAALVLNPDDAEVRANLAGCYEKIGIQPSPVGATTSSYLIDPTHPRVRQHVNDAFVLIVRNHEAARLRRAAGLLRDVAVRQFQVPPALVAVDGAL